MARLVLGPMLRYVDDSCATVWVETDRPCRVEVLGHWTTTFCVAGHHYAIVRIEGLDCGISVAYDVRLDGEVVWPEPDSPFPPSTIRTTDENADFTLAFGSCRMTAPNVPPYTLPKLHYRGGLGVDALHALARRMQDNPEDTWPHALLLLGDQVYADENISAGTAEFIASRRDVAVPPGREVWDFEEYCHLYREAWSEPTVRWLLSTLPTAMIFDDHDVRDDWNTSQTWRRQMQALPWWQGRIEAGLMTYWLYQHLGNMPPEEIKSSPLLARLQRSPDGEQELRDFARMADREADGCKGARWSYRRDYGRTRLVVVDSRCGRVLEGDHRKMVDPPEWQWINEQATGDVDHLLIATSLPYLLPPGIHGLEGWNEAVCNSAWGRWLAPLGEKLRQAVDLEHWAAFRQSFDAMADLVIDVATGRRGKPPASIVFLSGDVHYAYLAEAWRPSGGPLGSAVFQATCSPIRNPIDRKLQYGNLFAISRVGEWLGSTLSRLAGVREPDLAWSVQHGPWFDNEIAELEFQGQRACLRVGRAEVADGGTATLTTVFSHDIVAEAVADEATGQSAPASGR